MPESKKHIWENLPVNRKNSERMTDMKFSATITLQHDTPFSPFSAREYEEALDWLKTSGFDGAEVCISDYDGIDVQKVKKDLDDRGLGCSTISTGQARTLENISLLHAGEGLVKAQERIKQHINAAKILGCKVTIGLIRGLGTAGMEEQEKQILARNMGGIVDYAEQQQVTLMLEAINRYETTLFNSAAGTVAFIEKELGSPKRMGVLWDLFHANIEDARLDAAVDCLGGRLKHVHMADSNRMFPGYGHTDFKAVYRKIKAAGFDEYMSFECLNLPSLEVVRKEAGALIRMLRGL